MAKCGTNQEHNQVHPVSRPLKVQCGFHGTGIFTGALQYLDPLLDHFGIHFIGNLTFINEVFWTGRNLVTGLFANELVDFHRAIFLEDASMSPFKLPASFILQPTDHLGIKAFLEATFVAQQKEHVSSSLLLPE